MKFTFRIQQDALSVAADIARNYIDKTAPDFGWRLTDAQAVAVYNELLNRTFLVWGDIQHVRVIENGQ